MKLDQFLTPYAGMNSKWIKKLNVRCKTIKLLEENIGSKISNISLSTIFSVIIPWAREVKEKNKQATLHQTKMFLHS